MKNNAVAAQRGLATGSLKERQRAERTELILGAAQEIFVEKGFHASTIEEIAAQVGISKGAVYLHFASKDELLEALVARQITWFLGMVDDVVASASTVRARLERILAWVYGRTGGEYSPLVLELSVLGLADSVIDKRPALQAQIARATECIGALLDEGKRAGELDTAVPTPVMVAMFFGLLSPRGFAHLMVSGQCSPSELVAYVGRMFFAGFAAPSLPGG
jgi:AcrR family transcriptional regulator